MECIYALRYLWADGLFPEVSKWEGKDRSTGDTYSKAHTRVN